MSTETRNNPALDLVVQARDICRAGRRNYHLALVIDHRAGCPDAEIAAAHGTKTLYVANTIRKHRAGTCGCGSPDA